jgi:hypothetical protein
VIVCKGTRAVIAEVLAQDAYEGYEGREGYYDIEIKDTRGKYRHWKSDSDGGHVELLGGMKEFGILVDCFSGKTMNYMRECLKVLKSHNYNPDKVLTSLHMKVIDYKPGWHLEYSFKDLGVMSNKNDGTDTSYKNLVSSIREDFGEFERLVFPCSIGEGYVFDNKLVAYKHNSYLQDYYELLESTVEMYYNGSPLDESQLSNMMLRDEVYLSKGSHEKIIASLNKFKGGTWKYDGDGTPDDIVYTDGTNFFVVYIR